MNPNTIQSISRQVYSRFPEFKGATPTVKLQAAAGKSAQKVFVLTYRHMASLPGKKTLPTSIRVVATEDGRILKISTSR